MIEAINASGWRYPTIPVTLTLVADRVNELSYGRENHRDELHLQQHWRAGRWCARYWTPTWLPNRQSRR
jgi:hypothetical protein